MIKKIEAFDKLSEATKIIELTDVVNPGIIELIDVVTPRDMIDLNKLNNFKGFDVDRNSYGLKKILFNIPSYRKKANLLLKEINSSESIEEIFDIYEGASFFNKLALPKPKKLGISLSKYRYPNGLKIIYQKIKRINEDHKIRTKFLKDHKVSRVARKRMKNWTEEPFPDKDLDFLIGDLNLIPVYDKN